MAEKIKTPKGEEVWVFGYDAGRLLYFVTTKQNTRSPFYIYKVDGDSYQKLGSGKSPTLLEDKYFWNERRK